MAVKTYRAGNSGSSSKVPKRRTSEDRAVGPMTFLVLCALNELQKNDRHGAKVADQVGHYLGVVVDTAQIYVTLRRLKESEYVRAEQVGSQAKGPGALTLYHLETAGKEALSEASDFYFKVATAGRTTR